MRHSFNLFHNFQTEERGETEGECFSSIKLADKTFLEFRESANISSLKTIIFIIHQVVLLRKGLNKDRGVAMQTYASALSILFCLDDTCSSSVFDDAVLSIADAVLRLPFETSRLRILLVALRSIAAGNDSPEISTRLLPAIFEYVGQVRCYYTFCVTDSFSLSSRRIPSHVVKLYST